VRICRFNDDRLGVVEGDKVYDVTKALEILPAHRYPLPRFDPMIAHLDALRKKIAELLPSAPVRALAEMRLLSPVANPGKVIGAPVNYRKHLLEARADVELHQQNQVQEIQRIGLFLKATSSVVGPSESVAIAHPERRNDHEAELTVIIGTPGRNIARADAYSHVAGYCIGLDMTIRGPEERSLRKSIDTFTVLGPWLVTADEIEDAGNIDFSLTVNGEPRQKANTRDLILSVPELIEFASRFYTLHPGDVIMTGTPEGVGRVVPGDIIHTEFSGIGAMTVAVISAS